MGEHEFEPVRGLPGHLPAGETLLWQGAPSTGGMALRGLHGRTLGGYFLLLAAWRGADAALSGRALGEVVGQIVFFLGLGLFVLGVLALYAWGVARTTVYSITDRRIVLRVGVALQKAVNIPFALVESAAVRRHPDGSGDIALSLAPSARVGHLTLWPHARPWKLSRTEPSLREIAGVGQVAELLSRALAADAARRGQSAATPALVDEPARPARPEPVTPGSPVPA